MYPKLSGLHRSMESLQMPMSLPSAFPSSAPIPTPPTAPSEEDTEELPWSGSPRAGQLDRYVVGPELSLLQTHVTISSSLHCRVLSFDSFFSHFK